ncbi:hypothetical protein NL676_034764 [Syzygium grande]|nr:hypothetical protein NL676_034764 [Syzygium grande]
MHSFLLATAPLLFMYCLGCCFVTALRALTSTLGTAFPLVKSNPTGIPNFIILYSCLRSSTTTIFLLLALLLLHNSINKVHCTWELAWQDHQQQIYGQSHQSK